MRQESPLSLALFGGSAFSGLLSLINFEKMTSNPAESSPELAWTFAVVALILVGSSIGVEIRNHLR